MAKLLKNGTQKVVTMGGVRGVLEVKEVPATLVDVGSEFVTYVHRNPLFYSNRHYSNWTVSEQSTGTAITHGDT